MPNGKISNRSYFKNIVFDSGQEMQCYKTLLKFYPAEVIWLQQRKVLTDNPFPLRYTIDFETPDYYIEFKGNWALNSHHNHQMLKIKLYWFVNQYPDKPLLLVVDSPKLKIKGIRTTTLANLYPYLKHDLSQKQ